MAEDGPDPRIARLVDAVEAIERGAFDACPPPEETGELAPLARALARMAASVAHRLAESARLAELAEKANAGLVLGEVLDHVFESFREVIPYERIGFSVVDEERSVARAVWARSLAGPLLIPPGYRANLEGSSLREILETGRPRILNDLVAYLDAHPGSESTRLVVAEGIRSSLTCPLIASGRAVGFLFFSSTAPGTYANAHVAFFQQIAGQLALILEKGRLYGELERTRQELEEANAKLRELAATDPLTGLPNRRSLDERIRTAWRRAARSGAPLAIAIADVDHFKRYNDAYGHQLGDDCLRRVAGALAAELRRPDDFAARYGGEEFVVLLESTDAMPAIAMAERLRAAVEALGIPHEASDAAPFVTVSLGVAATRPRPGDSVVELLASADRSLYRAKAAGRNRVEPAPV